MRTQALPTPWRVAVRGLQGLVVTEALVHAGSVPGEAFPQVNEREAWHQKRRGRLLRLIVLGR